MSLSVKSILHKGYEALHAGVAFQEWITRVPSERCIKAAVTCNAEQVPVRFELGKQLIEISDVQDRWLSHDHRYFKVGSASRNIYILRYDVEQDTWELVFYKAKEGALDLSRRVDR